MKIEELKDKKILILGFGREGQDTFNFLKNYCKDIVIADKNNEKDYLKKIQGRDIIIKSPGISQNLIKPLISKNQVITSQTDIFLNNCNGIVIGITGTKGKSTTASLISKILSYKKIKNSLIGNIGKPALGYIKKDKNHIYIYEMSSFQLQNITKSPHIAVLLNIYRDHLDQHKNIREYYASKANITKFQTSEDFLIFNNKDKNIAKIVKKSKARKIPFDPDKQNLKIPDNINVYHDLIVKLAKFFDVKKEEIEFVGNKFKTLPYRMEYVGKYKGIIFYDNSAATIPEATILSIDKAGKSLKTLIAGGLDKGFDLKPLSRKISSSNISNLILFPNTGEKIAKLVKNKKIYHTKDMKEAVAIAIRETPKDSICLLAPGASSLNMFKDYKERGDLFKKYAKQLR